MITAYQDQPRGQYEKTYYSLDRKFVCFPYASSQFLIMDDQ